MCSDQEPLPAMEDCVGKSDSEWLLYAVVCSAKGLFISETYSLGDIFCMFHVKNPREQLSVCTDHHFVLYACDESLVLMEFHFEHEIHYIAHISSCVVKIGRDLCIILPPCNTFLLSHFL